MLQCRRSGVPTALPIDLGVSGSVAKYWYRYLASQFEYLLSCGSEHMMSCRGELAWGHGWRTRWWQRPHRWRLAIIQGTNCGLAGGGPPAVDWLRVCGSPRFPGLCVDRPAPLSTCDKSHPSEKERDELRWRQVAHLIVATRFFTQCRWLMTPGCFQFQGDPTDSRYAVSQQRQKARGRWCSFPYHHLHPPSPAYLEISPPPAFSQVVDTYSLGRTYLLPVPPLP